MKFDKLTTVTEKLVTNTMSILERLKILRNQFGLKQEDFARRIGLSQTTMSMIEVGKSRLTEKNLKLICVTFNVNEKWLRTGQGEIFAAPAPWEKVLVDIFRTLTPDTQDFLLEMARSLLKRQGG
jgi:transcriptional regulator with XRE-family HTH domain